MITIYPSYSVADKREPNPSFFSACGDLLGVTVSPFSSARAAMLFALRALGFTRMDEVLIPPYISDCVVSAISKTAFASMEPSERTRAMYVFHQFGYPQKLDLIARTAGANDWHIINCCVQSTFSRHPDFRLSEWGDFSILSLPKLYPCNLGGGLISGNDAVNRSLDEEYGELSREHEAHAERAFDSLTRARENPEGVEEKFEISSVYGYLPEVVTFPAGAYAGLPSDINAIETDISRRKKLLAMIHGRFPDRVPDLNGCEVVPFAVPVQLPHDQSVNIATGIRSRLGIEVPVMHFDFNLNMLEPDYRAALVIGCHESWSEDLVSSICDTIEKYVNPRSSRATD